jgi:hypothetical protein
MHSASPTIGTLAAAVVAIEVRDVLPLLLTPLTLDRVPGHLLHSLDMSLPCLPVAGASADKMASFSSASRRKLEFTLVKLRAMNKNFRNSRAHLIQDGSMLHEFTIRHEIWFNDSVP